MPFIACCSAESWNPTLPNKLLRDEALFSSYLVVSMEPAPHTHPVLPGSARIAPIQFVSTVTPLRPGAP